MVSLPPSLATRDPADAAAGLLRRVGFALLTIGLPLTVLLSRRGSVVVLPLGCALVAVALLLAAPSRRALVDARHARGPGPTRVALLLLLIWAALSVAWTPFPLDAAGRLGRLVGTALIATMTILALPERMRGTDLNLLPIGAGVGALATAALGLFDGLRPADFAFDPDDTLLSRAALGGTVAVFAALAWLMTRRRHATAIALYALALLAALAAQSFAATAGLAVGGFLLALSIAEPRLGPRIAMALLTAPILLAPLTPFLLRPFAKLFAGEGRVLAMMRTWAEIVRADPLRLVTGRGVGASQGLAAAGALPGSTPRALGFELWFDLGLVGALGVAAALALAIRNAAKHGDAVRAGRIGALGAAVTVAVLGAATAQAWWVAALAATAIGFAAVDRGQYRSVAPKVDDVRRVAGDS